MNSFELKNNCNLLSKSYLFARQLETLCLYCHPCRHVRHPILVRPLTAVRQIAAILVRPLRVVRRMVGIVSHSREFVRRTTFAKLLPLIGKMYW